MFCIKCSFIWNWNAGCSPRIELNSLLKRMEKLNTNVRPFTHERPLSIRKWELWYLLS